MDQRISQRVQARLDALGINPFEAERRANLKRGYINDLLIGKKTTVRGKALPSMAGALECDPEFLTGAQDTPRKGEHLLTQIEGIVEAGAWRDPGAGADLVPPLPVSHDARFRANELRLYMVWGDHAAGLGINAGSLIWVRAIDAPLRDGDVVLASRTQGGKTELTIRVVGKGGLEARPARGEIEPIKLQSASIVGLVVSAIRVFGVAH